jgi:PAS domain S-box-containing protein
MDSERGTGGELHESEWRFRQMADAVPQILWITDAEGRLEFFNKQWFDYVGSSAMPRNGRELAADYIHADDQPDTTAAFEAAVRTGDTYMVEHRIRSAAGDYRWFLVRGEPFRDPQTGEIIRWFGTSVDIHDRKMAEQGLRESEARLAFLDRLGAETAPLADADVVLATTTRLLGEHLQLSVCAYADMDEDEDGFTIRGDWAAPGSTSIVGHYSLADFGKLAVKNLGAGLPLVVNDNLRELAPEEAATFQAIGIAATICMPLVKEGRLTALMAIHDRLPRVWTEAELALLREVTERSWAHVERVAAVAELRDSEARYRTLFESIESGFCVVEVDLDAPDKRIDYRVVEANPAFYRHTGFPEEIGNRWLREAAPDLEESWYENYGRVARTGIPERFEQGSDHLGRWFDVFAFRTGAPEERRVGILFNDVSARRKAEEQLRELNETLEQRVIARTAERNRVWEMSRDLLAIMGFDGKLKAINPAWGTTFGRGTEALLALSFREQVHPDDHRAVEAMMERLLRGESVDRFEDRIRHADGSWRWISWTLVPEGDIFYAVGRDVTADKQAAADLEEAQDALRQSQKMEAMGQLTGGVAHDFNNLLTPIIGSLDMLLRRPSASERERRLIDGALQSAEKAKTLVQRLLAFARRQPLQAQPVDVAQLVDGMAELVASTSGPHVKVMVDAADDLPFALADPNQLEMAILNLSVNARDAMPDGGTLTISAKLDAVGAGHRSKLAPGRYVRLSVADTGVGMDEPTLARAVEPFFSTKGIGRGTGLGLSMVDGLAAQLGGALAIDSKPKLGTCIELWLPATDAPAARTDQTADVGRTTSAGTALLVDDEELVRASSAAMLADLGYSVIEAASGEEALRMVEEGAEFDLLVTDHLMPGMAGTDLARSLLERFPQRPALIVSGYAEVDGIAPDLPRLSKPFRLQELAGALAELKPPPK